MQQKLLWIDLEMTGLDPKNQRIIEVGVIVTDYDFTERARYEAVIHQPAEVLDTAEDWPKENMAELFATVSESKTDERQVIQELTQLIDTHFDGEPAVLAGNSIHQDRRFIRQWWPEVEAKLHYRMLDVSSFKIWIEATTEKAFEKTDAHRALEDIEESIAELKWSLKQLQSDN